MLKNRASQTIELTTDHAQFIRQRVQSGDYADASELIRVAIELLAAQKSGEEAQTERLRAELHKGSRPSRRVDLPTWIQGKNGRRVSGDVVHRGA